jgi:hypothetical protein
LNIEKEELTDTKRVVTHFIGQKSWAIIAQAGDAASQRRSEKNCVVLTPLIQSTVTKITQFLEITKLFTLSSNKFNETMKEVSDLQIKLIEYKEELHDGNHKQKTSDEVTTGISFNFCPFEKFS